LCVMPYEQAAILIPLDDQSIRSMWRFMIPTEFYRMIRSIGT